MLRPLLSLFALLFHVSSAQAATYTIDLVFDSSQMGTVHLNVDLTADFSTTIGETTTGLKVNTLTASALAGDLETLIGGLGYLYWPGVTSSTLMLGGLARGATSLEFDQPDIFIQLRDIETIPSVAVIFARSGGRGAADTLYDATSLTSTLAVVPLPAGGLLLLTGLAGLGWRRRRQDHATKAQS
ncbi:VPLPA-CTERM sorting domain-containing protein [Poseidonocella sedimentorum]|uniref:VPLPA-CTERM protein sorting domain-containing protein n=1 Tax=Poseidonocella sedimentorum TaxID=871652 RepID=A0A1I6CR23_9RHOB|nr:VPLPA-CTERM sorting domain-containing protein [Poseidonocella sedimentorum]SFQ95655.1 VPLPA-CTERM protein sorting domain-containing protein [Poseidonocella sedimentorum]